MRRGRRSHADHAVDGEALTNEATRQRAVRSVDRLCLGSALEVERQLAGGGAARGDDERRQVDRAVDRLVPLDVGRPVHLEGVDGSERGPGGGEGASGQSGFDRAALCLEAPNAHPEDWVVASVARVEEALGPGRPPFGAVRLAVGPRREHAPLEAHLVLAGGRPVGVEDVPLVEDRVGHCSRRFEAVLYELR